MRWKGNESLYQQDLKWTQPDSDNHGSQKKQRHCRSVHVLRLIQDSELFTLYAPLRGVAFQPSNERAVYFQEKNTLDSKRLLGTNLVFSQGGELLTNADLCDSGCILSAAK